jgi:hypothetical protein
VKSLQTGDSPALRSWVFALESADVQR